MIYKSCKKLTENCEEYEIFTNKYTENVGGKSEWIADKITFGKLEDPPTKKLNQQLLKPRLL